MQQFKTIRQASRATSVPEWRLRQLVKQKRVPGFYSGSRFYVNLDMFLDQLDAECRANAAGEVCPNE